MIVWLRLVSIWVSISITLCVSTAFDVLNDTTLETTLERQLFDRQIQPIVANNCCESQRMSTIDIVMTENDFGFQYFMDYVHKNGLYFVEEVSEKCSSIMSDNSKVQVWMLSVLCSTIIGVSSMFPLLLISLSDTNYLVNSDSSSKTLLKYLLSFGVGGLLGDVFLHLLPEASDQLLKTGLSARNVQMSMGFWVLVGILCFAFTETFASHLKSDSGSCRTNGHISNGSIKDGDPKPRDMNRKPKSLITGYLNILANGFDNLTHGLAVGASFLVSTKVGLLTTIAIAIHEIPHEIGDFAILIQSGFSKWQAVRAQVSIACVTVLGALAILLADSADAVGAKTAWILPFTSGGFLHISLVSILPELLAEQDFKQSVKQGVFVCLGVAVMSAVNTFAD